MRDAKSELAVSESEKEAMRNQYKKSLDRRETEKKQLEFQVMSFTLDYDKLLQGKFYNPL